MPLQEASALCMLGHCTVHGGDGDKKTVRNKQSGTIRFVDNTSMETIKHKYTNENFKGSTCTISPDLENCGSLSCGCQVLNQTVGSHREALIRDGNWIQLLSKSQGVFYRKSKWVPEFHHMHQNGHFMSNCDFHVCKSRNHHSVIL